MRSRSSTRTSPTGCEANSVAEPAQANPSRTPATNFSETLLRWPFSSFPHSDCVVRSIFIMRSDDIERTCFSVGPTYMHGIGLSSKDQPRILKTPSVFPICAPQTITTDLNRESANAAYTAGMYGVRDTRNRPGSGESGGSVRLSSAHCPASRSGGGRMISAAVASICESFDGIGNSLQCGIQFGL